MSIIDLRSDTVTLPPEEMIHAMVQAPLGDDVFGEDPSINQLEHYAAELSGKEAALYVPSGTMGNLIAVLVHCQRGDEVILGNKSHTFIYECGGISSIGGVHSHQLPNESDGTILLDNIQKAIRLDNIHFPNTALISLENTHNVCNGNPISTQYVNSVCKIAKTKNIKVHIDGARIWNASISLNEPLDSMLKNVNSISFCLSKALSCPIGSVLCGTNEFISNARKIRKALGGGMRQAGIIASAGTWALKNMFKQIKKDHEHAQQLALGLEKIEWINIKANQIKTNIVYFSVNFQLMNKDKIITHLLKNGIKILHVNENIFRMVTHYGITKNDINFTLKTIKEIN